MSAATAAARFEITSLHNAQQKNFRRALNSRRLSPPSLSPTESFLRGSNMSGRAASRLVSAAAAGNDGSAPGPVDCASDFGFDAEVAADLAEEVAVGSAPSPPIAVPASKAGRLNLAVQVSYEPPEFRIVSDSPSADSSLADDAATDSPIGGGLMYAPLLLPLIFV